MEFCTLQLPSTATRYTPLEHQILATYWALLETGFHGNGAHSLVYPHYHYDMDKGSLPMVAHTATNTSLLKWEWLLQEQIKPDVTGLSKLQEDVVSSFLNPLSPLEELMDSVCTALVPGDLG